MSLSSIWYLISFYKTSSFVHATIYHLPLDLFLSPMDSGVLAYIQSHFLVLVIVLQLAATLQAYTNVTVRFSSLCHR
jgi:hypothetical protein